MDQVSTKIDMTKWALVAVFLIAGFIANYYYIQVPLALRIVGWIVLTCVILLIAAQTVQGKKAWKFFCEARDEMRKVVWPTRQETLQTTLVVSAIVVAFALIMWGIDSILMWAVNLLTGQ